MHDSKLAELGGCFLEQIESNGSFGKLISRHPCEVPIENGVYVDEDSFDPVARFDGRAENLLAAADPDLDKIWAEERREQKARHEAMRCELSVWDAQTEADFDRADEMEESDELGFSINGRYFATQEELNEFIGISDDLHWPQDTWYSEELKEHDPNESFPQPIKPKQAYETRAEDRRRAKRNGGCKPVGRKNCRVAIRQADKVKQKILFRLEEENGGHDLLDEILEDSLQAK